MSIESAQEFIDRANQDQVIRKLARDRFGDIVNVGREHGFDFELDEFDLAMRERKAQGGGPSGSQCSAGDVCQCAGRHDAEVCQCPTGSTGTVRDAEVCQCPSGSTGTFRDVVCQCPSGSTGTVRDAVCQCGPSGSTGTVRDAVCQCGPSGSTGTDADAVCQCGPR